jgi:osmoprotectant transport system substrate-binding protein
MKMSVRTVVGCLLAVVMAVALLTVVPGFAAEKKLVVGSKAFTEQRILGAILIALLEKNGFQVEDKTGLGGTVVVREALVNKQIDTYVEYTGTGLLVLLKHEKGITDPKECYETVKKEDLEKNSIVWLPYMNFNNTYCLMMRDEDAKKLNIKTLSDLGRYVKANKTAITLGLNGEFYARADGYRPLQEAYGLEFPDDKIVKMDPGLLYNALKDGQVQVALGFATDGRIKGFNLVVLEDDKHFFPVYNASVVIRKDTAATYPELEKIFGELAKKLDTAAMTDLNYQVDVEHKTVKDVARDWLKKVGLL